VADSKKPKLSVDSETPRTDMQELLPTHPFEVFWNNYIHPHEHAIEARARLKYVFSRWGELSATERNEYAAIAQKNVILQHPNNNVGVGSSAK
jgi:hypothetical protein